MHATDVVGYMFQADIYCPAHIVNAVAPGAHDSEDDAQCNAETHLAALAQLRGINREDESSYDSGDFPKVIFGNHAHDGCYPANGYLPGQCGDACAVCHEPLGGDCPNEDVPQEWLDEFTQGYALAMLWANTIEYNDTQGTLDGGPASTSDVDPYAWLDGNDAMWALHAFTPQSQAQIVEDVTDFVRNNWSDLQALPESYARDSTVAETAGHDFALTRNGHGAGFWDRGLGELGDRLTEASHPYGSSTASYSAQDDGSCVSLDDERAAATE